MDNINVFENNELENNSELEEEERELLKNPREELHKFLDENPHMWKFQHTIFKRLKNVSDINKRLGILYRMILECHCDIAKTTNEIKENDNAVQ